MLALRYLLWVVSFVLFGSAAGLVGYDVWVACELQKLLGRGKDAEGTAPLPFPGAVTPVRTKPDHPVRWKIAAQLSVAGIALLLLGSSFALVPDGFGAVRVSQISGVQQTTLYPGMHLVVPLVQHIAEYDLREHVYETAATPTTSSHASQQEQAKPKAQLLTVQAREGLSMGLGIAVRYRLDPQKLAYIHSNVPQPLDQEVIEPVVASTLRDVAADYVVRDVFSVHRAEFEQRATKAITQRLAQDGVIVKEVSIRDIQLPVEYAKGLESLLLKEQESERMVFETEIKEKQVKIDDLEAEGQKARDIRQAEGAAQVRVLQAKAEADAMQYTLPLKQKQIEQSKLEAEARKEATVENAQAAADSKVIDSKAEVERRKLMAEAKADEKVTDSKAEVERRRMLADADANTIRVTAAADSERMNLEAAALKANPLLIQKMIAERLSDKLQIIMVPMDGKNFFAGDVLKSAFGGIPDTDPTPAKPLPTVAGRRPN